MNRYYDNRVGRFLSPDPYGASAALTNPQSWNRYAYVVGDPVNFRDPSGLDEQPTYCDVYTDDPRCHIFQACPDGSIALTGGACLGSLPSEVNLEDTHSPQSRAQRNWDKAMERLSDANNLLQNLDPSGPCQDDFRAILSSVSRTLADVQFQANISTWLDATTATYLVRDLYTPGTSEYMFYDSKQGFTIQKLFKNSPSTKAVSGLTISALSGYIFFDPKYISSHSAGFNAALLAHEVMHNLGLTDGQLLHSLGFDRLDASGKVTNKLAQDCFGVTH